MFRECILPVKSVPVDAASGSSANESLLPGQIHSVTGSLKGSVSNAPLVGSRTCLWSWWSTCAYPCLAVVMSSSFFQVANLFTDVTGRKCSAFTANLFWRNHYAPLRKCHLYFGIPLTSEIFIICEVDQSRFFFLNPQINITFLFNIANIIGL